MTDHQPIQTTAAVTHLRRVAIGIAPGVGLEQQPEWLAADLIEWQAAQIERMRDALVAARRVILSDRTALVACFAAPGCEDDLAPEDERALAEYDEALRMIDEAMGETG